MVDPICSARKWRQPLHVGLLGKGPWTTWGSAGITPQALCESTRTPEMDALIDTDWAAHWRRLVEERDAQASHFHDPLWWDARARSYAASTGGRKDGFLDLLA